MQGTSRKNFKKTEAEVILKHIVGLHMRLIHFWVYISANSILKMKMSRRQKIDGCHLIVCASDRDIMHQYHHYLYVFRSLHTKYLQQHRI